VFCIAVWWSDCRTIDASFSEVPLNARFMTVFSFCHASPPYVGASSDALLEVSESLLAKRSSITSGLKGWLVGWLVFILRLLMGIKSTISPPKGYIRRAKLWNYSAVILL
jgi:hypothetical protein